MSRQNPLENLSTRELLKLRLCDLKVDIKNTPIHSQIRQLYAEIKRTGIRFRPHVWVSTSWFSPYGVPGFALPFYLLHPRLAELEQKYIGEVEGGSPQWCMQLLRHETGHAIDNAFHLRKSKTRQRLFGLSGQLYPRRYAPNPRSRDFVIHLDNHYAQAHPDEDWAETFAVWLDPQNDWRTQYKGWRALEKLELANALLSSIARQDQKVFNLDTLDELSTCKQTLREYFEEKQRKFATHPKTRDNIIVQTKKHWITM